MCQFLQQHQIDLVVMESTGVYWKSIEPWKEAWQILQTLPGVSEMSAATLIAEIGDDMSKFGGMKEIASWAGLCPGSSS